MQDWWRAPDPVDRQCSGMTNLYYLNLSGNHLTNISILQNLPRLQQVYIGGNYLDISSNSAALAVIQSLQTNGVDVEYQPQSQIQPPSIWIQDTWLVAKNSTGQINFSLWDLVTPADQLAVSARSSN